MQTNTLSNRQDLHLIHNTTEGTFNRSLPLLLLTNKESAYRVMNTNRFPNDLREFGRGLYFVENLEESEAFDIEDKAVVLCQVFVGVSLILTKPDQNITEKILKGKNCDSVKGYLNLNQKYYIVYNYKKIEKILALKAQSSVVRNFEVGSKCVNHLCKFHGTNHIEECQLFCKEKTCRFYNGYHEPPCELRCETVNCELLGDFHKSRCKLRCTWENCVMFGKYHESKCIHLDHEKANEDTEGEVYNKVVFREKMSKVETKKKSKNLNKKRMENREIKLDSRGIQSGNYDSALRNKFSKDFDQFPRLGEGKKQVLRGHYEIDGAYGLKKVKDVAFNSKNYWLNQPKLINQEKSANELLTAIQDEQFKKVVQKRNEGNSTSKMGNLVGDLKNSLIIRRDPQPDSNKNNLSRPIENNSCKNQNEAQGPNKSKVNEILYVVGICSCLFILSKILF